jgi:ribA/ribD-fused uncharacterized protein
MDEEVIGFWAQREKYGCFSNFHPCEFIWRGVKFNCSEQAFMYAKATFFGDDEIAEKIMCESDPRKIKKLGRQIKNFDDNTWGQVRYEYMLAINKEKYFQNQDLKNRLLSTNNAVIVEDSPYDYIWGIGKNGTGQNLLGKVLMETRDWLRS